MVRAASGRASWRIAADIELRRAVSPSKLAHDATEPIELLVLQNQRGALVFQKAGVVALIVSGRVHSRDENGRQSGRGELTKHRSAGTHHGEVRRRHCIRHVFQKAEHVVAGAIRLRRAHFFVPRARDSLLGPVT